MGGFNTLVLFSFFFTNQVLAEINSESQPEQNILLFTCYVIPEAKLPLKESYEQGTIKYDDYWKEAVTNMMGRRYGTEKVNLIYKGNSYGTDCHNIYGQFIDCLTWYNKTKSQYTSDKSFLYISGPFCEVPFHTRAMKPLKKRYCSMLAEDVLIVTTSASIMSEKECQESKSNLKFEENVVASNLVYLSGIGNNDAKLMWNLLVEHFGWKTFVLLSLTTTGSNSFCPGLFDAMYSMSEKDRNLLVKKFFWTSNNEILSNETVKNIWLSLAKITRVIILCSNNSFLFQLLNEIEHDNENRNKYAVIFLKVSEDDVPAVVKTLKSDGMERSLKYLKIVVPQSTIDCPDYGDKNGWGSHVRLRSNRSGFTFTYPYLNWLNSLSSFGIHVGRYICSLGHYFDLVSKLLTSNRSDANEFRLSDEFSTTYRLEQPRHRSQSDYSTDMLTEVRLFTYDENEDKFVPAMNLTWREGKTTEEEAKPIVQKFRTIFWHNDDETFNDALFWCENKSSLFQCRKTIKDPTDLIYSITFGLIFGLLLAAGLAYGIIQLVTKKSKVFLLRRYQLLPQFLSLKKTKASCGDVLSGKYKEQTVLVVPIRTSLEKMNLKSREIMQDLDSVARFSKSKNDKFVEILGFVSKESRDFRLVFKVGTESNLRCVLKEVKLTLELKFSLIRDLTLSLNEVHQSSLKCHGSLKTNRCIVDDRFVLRLMLVRLPGLRKLKKKLELKSSKRRLSTEVETRPSELLWSAPELLRKKHAEATQPGDVYSFAIVMHEIVFQRGPFYVKELQGVKHGQAKQQSSTDVESSIRAGSMSGTTSHKTQFESMASIHASTNSPRADSERDESCAEIIINKVRDGPFRPAMPFVHVRPKFRLLEEIIEQCWNEKPDKRPKTADVLQRLQVYMKKENIDAPFNTSRRLQQYSKKLVVRMVNIKSEAILERDRALKYLVHMIPSHLSYELMKGAPNPAPDKHENVTIHFNDLVEFSSLMKQQRRQDSVETIEILHEVFQAYDQIVKLYDVVPLHRVGSSLLLASGVLHKTSIHAIEIAQPALQMRQFAKSYTRIKLNLRGGIHSGTVMSGICGKRIPQYGLFGDTVNTASRMASYGVAGEIQISEATYNLLMQSQSPKFHFTGPTEKMIKGKNIMKTYMLVGCGNYGANIPLKRRLDDRPVPTAVSSDPLSPSTRDQSRTTLSRERFTLTARESAKMAKKLLLEEDEFDQWDEHLNSEHEIN